MSSKGRKNIVVIAFAEALAAAETTWSLNNAGYEILAIARKGCHSVLRHSNFTSITEVTSPNVDSQTTLAEVERILAETPSDKYDHKVVLPLDDTSVWMFNELDLPKGWISAGPSDKAARFALDKSTQIQEAKAAGIPVLDAITINTKEEFLNLEACLPVILRPSEAVRKLRGKLSKGRNWICSDRQELVVASSSWNEQYQLIAQRFVQGIGKGVFGIATDSGIHAWSSHRRVRMMNPHGSGSSACISQRVSAEVKEPIERMIRKIGWRGHFMVELLLDENGVEWFVEFNGRAWGSLALARKQGLEYPSWTVQAAINQRFVPDVGKTQQKTGILCRNLGREIMHLFFVLRGPKSKVYQNWPSFPKTLFRFFADHGRAHYYNWNRDDWRILLSDCWITIHSQLFKKK